MNNWKCSQCGLVNFASVDQCKRCGASSPIASEADEFEDDVPSKGRSLRQRLLWVAGMTVTILFICYASLRLTSEQVNWQQRETIERAVKVLDERGFSRQAFVLSYLVSFRTTDNWWNMQVGHASAFAATNFPFEIMTLYPDFFDMATNDTERAAILLHESYHLFGSDEATALEGTWRNKAKIGWTEELYRNTPVWRSTKDLTMRYLPQMFRCGIEQNTDCISQ